VTKKLSLALSGLSEAKVSHWFKTVDETVRTAGLLWAVATQRDKDEMLGGEAALIQELEKQNRWVKKETRDNDTSNLDTWLCPVEGTQSSSASYVIKISLRETKQTLWLGVSNPTFELELDYLSPWAAFILRFGEIADIALQRIINRQDREKFEKEAADFHGLATTAIVTGTVIHQMVNQVRELTSPITILAEAIKSGRLKGNYNHKELISSLSDSAGQIEDLTKLFSGVTKPDDRRPCPLNEAVQYAVSLLRDSFARYNIRVDPQVSSSHIVDVPFYVAAFTLANLLNNAKDAIRDGTVKEGLIEVRAEEAASGKMILCHVTDNGPGVPKHMISHLFESSGKSDKPHGSGLGLYLSARSLREARGDIKLTYPGPDPRTTFTIHFPKQRKD
jgi:signal transduction histidine kinase